MGRNRFTMDAIVFASYIPSIEKLYIGKEFLNIFEIYFKDVDIYIGINPPSIPEWEDLIKSYQKKINIKYDFVQPELNVGSDASGYQNALLQLKKSGKQYDTIWFGHTKGGNYNDAGRAEQREYMLNNFWSKRNEIKQKLFSKNIYGSYGPVATISLTPNKPDVLDNYAAFKYPCNDVCFLYTFFCIKGHIIDWFLKNCYNNFFETNLRDKYFFEDFFPHIATKQGYLPLHGIPMSFPKGNVVSDERISNSLLKWALNNNINLGK